MSDAPAHASGDGAVAFSEINQALKQRGDHYGTQARALMATVVAVSADDRLAETEGTLQELASRCAVRAILISQGTAASPPATVAGQIVELTGLKPRYVDNAVAALRLSSLPTLVWFRGGTPDLLHDLADLADRVVLDEIDPAPSWRQAVRLADRTAFSDLRWTRLTRWRTLMANFFDVPRVREAARTFQHLRIRGSDRVSADLYASWLRSTLSPTIAVDLTIDAARAPIEEVRLGNEEGSLLLRLSKSRTCIHMAYVVRGQAASVSAVSIGDQRLTSLMADELRVRARDVPFERAMAAALGIH
jgi:glucose-6-phosphate dehydrogenase assembly protein OpcA